MIKKYVFQGILLSLTASVMAEEIDELTFDADQIDASLQNYVVISKKLLKLNKRALMFNNLSFIDHQAIWKSPSPIGGVCCDLVFEFPKTTYIASDYTHYIVKQDLKIYDSDYKELSCEWIKASNDQSDDKVDRVVQSVLIYGDIPPGEIIIMGNYSLVFTFYGKPLEISLDELKKGPIQCDDGRVALCMMRDMTFVGAWSLMDMPECEIFKVDGTPYENMGQAKGCGLDGDFDVLTRVSSSPEDENLIFKINMPQRQKIVTVPVSFIINVDFSTKPEKKE